jgi:hypothetical protein
LAKTGLRRHSARGSRRHPAWELRQFAGFFAAAIALANKIAGMAWAVMAKGERYKEPVALAA